jgi:hypothetical protein
VRKEELSEFRNWQREEEREEIVAFILFSFAFTL